MTARVMGPLLLRNRIVRAINNWEQLGCKAISGNRFFVIKGERKGTGFHLLVFGVAPDGRAILIYPQPHRGKVPIAICMLMMDFHTRGALVGCAKEIGDAYDVIVDNPSEYKRKRRTWRFEWELEQYLKRRKQNGKTGRNEEE